MFEIPIVQAILSRGGMMYADVAASIVSGLNDTQREIERLLARARNSIDEIQEVNTIVGLVAISFYSQKLGLIIATLIEVPSHLKWG